MFLVEYNLICIVVFSFICSLKKNIFFLQRYFIFESDNTFNFEGKKTSLYMFTDKIFIYIGCALTSMITIFLGIECQCLLKNSIILHFLKKSNFFIRKNSCLLYYFLCKYNFWICKNSKLYSLCKDILSLKIFFPLCIIKITEFHECGASCTYYLCIFISFNEIKGLIHAQGNSLRSY